jgi:hypothetical protein
MYFSFSLFTVRHISSAYHLLYKTSFNLLSSITVYQTFLICRITEKINISIFMFLEPKGKMDCDESTIVLTKKSALELTLNVSVPLYLLWITFFYRGHLQVTPTTYAHTYIYT